MIDQLEFIPFPDNFCMFPRNAGEVWREAELAGRMTADLDQSSARSPPLRECKNLSLQGTLNVNELNNHNGRIFHFFSIELYLKVSKGQENNYFKFMAIYV